MRPTPRTLAEHLLQRGSRVSELLVQARDLAEADRRLRETLGAPFADRIRLANLRDEQAIVLVDSATTLTLLRFRQQELLQALQSQDGVTCAGIEFRIDPTLVRV